MRWLSRLVTGAVIVTVVGVVVLLLRSKLPNAKNGEGFVTWAKFRDGSRFAAGSPVVIAGVRVGDISRVAIEGTFARIDMNLKQGLQIPVDSFVTRRSDSLFGDNYVEIILSGGEDDARVRYLKSGEPLTHVIEGGSTDTVLRGIAKALPKINNALDTFHDFLAESRRAVNGKLIERLGGADHWLSEGNIERPIAAAERAMIKVEDATTRAASAVADAAPDIANRLASFDRGITNARKNIKDVKTGLVSGLSDVRSGVDRIDEPVGQMSEVMSAINDGRGADWKGSLGRLINDPELANTIQDVTEDGRDAALGLNQFKSWLGMRVEFNLYSGLARVYATAELRARDDKFYLVEFEKSGLGGVPTDELSDAAGTAAYTRRLEIYDALRLTLQFGKRFGPIALRGGLKDSTPGVGIDALMLDGRLQLSADVFGSFQRVPRVKVAAAVAVFRSLYVLAGIDDAFTTPGTIQILTGNTTVPDHLRELRYGRDYFLGAMLHFDEADLATLLRVYSAILAGALAF